jgi:hypothetical protein
MRGQERVQEQVLERVQEQVQVTNGRQGRSFVKD